MKKKGNDAIFLDAATTDILESVINDFGLKLSEEDMIDSEAYILLHRDNPDTKEILGSINLRFPFEMDDETKKNLKERNIPTEKVFLTCFGVFDAYKKDFDVSIRCNARNEHGFPIYCTNTTTMTKIQNTSDILTEKIKKEIKEDVEALKIA